MIKTVRRIAVALPTAAILAGIAAPLVLAAQQPTDTTKPAPQPAPPAIVSVPVDFSGVLYANFQYRGDKGPSKSQNKFDLERAYLTFRMPAGDRASIRVTADVFQQTTAPNDAFYRGWVIRVKYAYLQYDYLKTASWNGVVRGGLIHNVVIDHMESFWPRWISLTPVERSGFFSSSDAGVGTLITLPKKFGEFYATIVNGPGYTSRETDRFKDYAARLSITPLSGSSNKVIKTFALTGWTYRGAVASSFAAGGAGQIGPVGSSLPRTRSGVFLGVRDPRLSAGAEWDTRKDARETGANTLLSPRAEVDSTGRLISGFANIKPFQLINDKSALPLGLIARWDRFKPNTATASYVNTVIGGLTWDLNKKTALSLDYQEQTPKNGAIAAVTKTYFLHLVANF
ncbi:MAG TPA: hypothetical protein VHE82_00960 [Gemmatimonadaceae bacterium]|nr:hypothetical protein [Gemmatimonadaceae bacterium]